MTSARRRGCVPIAAVCALTIAAFAAPARADEIWVAPTAQQDFGGLTSASNVIWPVSPYGVVRMAWSVPDNLSSLQGAKVVLIPHSPAVASTLTVYVCSSQNGALVSANCTGPASKPFTGVANQLVEVEIADILAPFIGSPGASYLAVIAYTTPTAASDHFVGLRFGYEPTKTAGVATLAANTFTGVQVAPAFVGNGAGLTNLPIPAGVATLGANAFSGPQIAPVFVGNGAELTNLQAGNLAGVVDSKHLPIGSTAGTVAAGNDPRFSHPDGACFDNSNRYVDCGNGTVTDTVTGLIWLKQMSCLGYSAWAEANQAAAALKNGECGLTDKSSAGDWRLPTKAEWQATMAHALALFCVGGFSMPSLTDDAGTGCFRTGTTSFTGFSSVYYWSATPTEFAPTSAAMISVFDGYIENVPKDFTSTVWPVRRASR